MHSGMLSVPLSKIEFSLERAKGASDLEPSLKALISLQRSIEVDRSLYGKKLYFTGVDLQLASICSKLHMTDAASSDETNERVVIIATEVYAVGGHTRIIEDIRRLVAPKSCTLILTDPNGVYDHFGPLSRSLDFLREAFPAIVICKNPSILGRIFEVYSILNACNPTRIFLVNHHADIISVVASWPFRKVVNFIHHTDYLPCFGASVGEFKHVDVTFKCHTLCKDHIKSASYVGMSLPQSCENGRNKAPTGDLIDVATSGTQRKFSGSGSHLWTDWVISALSSNVRSIRHIGPTTREFQDEIREKLASSHIAVNRYEFLGQVRNLSAKLLEIRIDVYMSSYPESGFRGNLEALACGLPVVVLEDESTPDLLRFNFPAPGWRIAHGPQELPRILTEASRSNQPDRELIAKELDRFAHFVQST